MLRVLGVLLQERCS